MNNHVTNLEWVTNKENQTHASVVLQRNCKAIKRIDKEGNVVFYPSTSKAAREMNVNRTGITNALAGRVNTYKGFRWEFVKEGVETIRKE